MNKQQLNGLKKTAQKVSLVTLQIEADDYEVFSNKVVYKGQIVENQEKVRGSYIFKNESEKNKYQQLDSPLTIVVTGELLPTPAKRNLGAFDYRQFLAQQGVYRQLDGHQIERLIVRKPTSILSYLKMFRKKLHQKVNRELPETVASYVKALILGIKDQRFKENQTDFSRLGILHFFSISGLHVYFFLGLVDTCLRRLRLTSGTIVMLSLIFLVCFAILTGLSTSVGRSVIYIGLVLLNRHYRLQLTLLDCWSICLMISLLIQPYVLYTAAGQLSFGLTWLIIFLTPLVANWASTKWQTALFGFLVSLFSIPIVSYHFYEWQLSSLALTVLLMPIFSYVLMPSLLLLFLATHLIDTTILSGILGKVLQFGEGLLFQLNTLSFFHVTTGAIPLLVYFLCLGLIGYWLVISRQRDSCPKGLLFLIILVPTMVKYINPMGYVAFVDVGQGDALVIREPFNKGTTLVDTGGKINFGHNQPVNEKRKGYAKYGLLPFLKFLGVDKIDNVFITHGHVDHYGDLEEVAEQVPVDTVIFPKGTTTDKGFRNMALRLEKNGVSFRSVLAPKVWQLPSMSLQALYPVIPGVGSNDDSFVFKMRLKNKTFMLMGDLELAGEKKLVKLGHDLKADILSVGHHGSATSTADFLLKQVAPSEAIISCGVANRFGHPNQLVLDRLSDHGTRVYRTDQQGMIYYQWSPFFKELSRAHVVLRE